MSVALKHLYLCVGNWKAPKAKTHWEWKCRFFIYTKTP